MTFTNAKKTFLAKPDKSQAGGIDKAIQSLVTLINTKKNYYTTSSCAGRILLLKQQAEAVKKHETSHFFVSHDPVSATALLDVCEKLPQEEVIFHLEGMILHVCCKTMKDAEHLLNLARDSGLKRSGIVSISKEKMMVEIIDTQRLELPIACKGKLMVSEEYIAYLLEKANKKLEETR